MTNAATTVPRTTDSGSLQAPPRDLLRNASLFLDFDGTLVEIASRPDGVEVDERLRALIARLSETLGGRLAVVSGRPMDTIVEYLGDGFAVSGSHGLEMRWADGSEDVPERPETLDTVLSAMHALAARHEGLLVEEKPFGAGLHYREAPEHEAECRALAERLADETGLSLQDGKMLFELRLPGAHKGAAIAAFMDGKPFADSRPIFLGDDVTDEDGFQAVAHLGGAGVLIGDPRPTNARFALAGVPETLAWLEAAEEAAR